MADKDALARQTRKAQLGLFKSEDMDEFINIDNPIALIDRWIVPPFSVLDARQGYWQERKRQWLSYGIKSELGRGDNLGDNGLLGESEQKGNVTDRHLRLLQVPEGRFLPDPVEQLLIGNPFGLQLGL